MTARLSEAAIQSAVLAHWRALGRPNTLVAAIPNARAHGQAGLTAGLPDLIAIGPGIGVGFVELKTDTGKVRPAQAAFGALCRAIGVRHPITRGRDEPIAMLELWGVVRPRVGAPA